MSDYDFAVFMNAPDARRRFHIRAALMDELGRLLQTDAVDVVVLNDAHGSELKYAIVSEGKVAYERDPAFRLIIEPKILNEYFDFRASLKKSGIVQPLQSAGMAL